MAKKGILKGYSSIFDLMHRFFDLVGVVSGCFFAYWVRHDEFILAPHYQQAIWLVLVLSFIVFRSFGLYQSWRGISLVSEIRRVMFAWMTVFIILTLLVFLFKQGHYYSREWAILWFLISSAFFIGMRLIARLLLRWFRSGGKNYRSVVIVGATDLSGRVIKQVSDLQWLGYRVIGLFDEASGVPRVGVFKGVPVCGGLSDLAKFVGENEVDQVWLCLPLKAEDEMKKVIHELRFSTADIRFIPDIFGFDLLNHSLSEVAGIPIIDLSATPLEGWNRVKKELEDNVLAFLILLAISPLMIVLAIGVKLSSPGPVLFRQKRHGWDGREIEVWKFRTMKVHEECGGTVTQASKEDSRVTRLGAILRKTSLDELPQFFNVLQGRMSIVGPRPHAVEHNEMYKDIINHYMRRHKVKPGITGWAQINGYRGETDTIEKMRVRVEYDLFYIENWSLFFDLKIIFFTFFKGFVHKNAY